MAEQDTVQVGKALFTLTGNKDPFVDGRTTGYLEFHDERHRPPFPLTNQTIHNHLVTILNEPSMPSLWNVGRITGWMKAFMENSLKPSEVFLQRNRGPFRKRRNRRDEEKRETSEHSLVSLTG